MSSANPLHEKSYALAQEIVFLCRSLQNKNEYILSKQLLRSGTSIGANVHEASYGQSKADFISKLSISLKETHETQYWVRLLVDTNYVQSSDAVVIQGLLREVLALLIASIKTAKKTAYIQN